MAQNSIARQQADDQEYLVEQYQGTVKLDQAQVDAQALNIAYCHIVSPVTGRIGLRLVDPGNYVQTSSSSSIAVVTQLQPITVIFTVPEDDLPDIMPQYNAGTALQVTAFDRANVKQLAIGKVSAVDSQIDTTTGTVKLRAQFDNSDGALFPNQFVNAQLLVRTLTNVVTVPTVAIQRGSPNGQQGSYVYVVNSDNTVIGAADHHRSDRRQHDRDQYRACGRRSCGGRRRRPVARRLHVNVSTLDGKPPGSRRGAGRRTSRTPRRTKSERRAFAEPAQQQPIASAGGGQRAGATIKRCDERLRTLHSASGRHLAPDGGDHALGHGGLYVPAAVDLA